MSPSPTEEALRRFLVDEAGPVEAPEALAYALVERARHRHVVRRRTALAVLAAAVVVVAVGLVSTIDTGSSRVRINPAGPTSTEPTTTTVPPATKRPTSAVVATNDGRVVLVDTGDGHELYELYRVADSRRNVIGGLALSADRVTVYIEVYGSSPDPAANCTPKHYAVSLASRHVTEVPNLNVSPAFSPDGRSVAMLVDASKYGGPSGPGLHCRQAIMVRDLQTGQERVWAEKPANERLSVQDEAPAWSPDSAHVVFQRGYNGASGDAEITEIRELDIARAGDIEAASTMVATRTAPVPGTTKADIVASPVVAADGGVAYISADKNTHQGAVVLHEAESGKGGLLWDAGDAALNGVRADAGGQHLLVMTDRGVYMVEVRGGVKPARLIASGSAVW